MGAGLNNGRVAPIAGSMVSPIVLALSTLAVGGATPVVPPDAPPEAPSSRPAVERATVAAINRVRRRASLRRVRVGRPLSRAAARHGAWLLRSDRFQHEGPRGEPFWTRLRPVHARGPHGEVIAFNESCRARDARRVVRAWMNSPTHRRVLMSPRFRWVGISVMSPERCGFGIYVADFGS